MFQPQSTPYSTVFSSSYGVDSAAGNFVISQPNAGAGGGVGGVVVDSGGPTVFRETLFSPVAYNLAGVPLSFNTTGRPLRPQQYDNKMSDHDLRAQERAAEEYERGNRIEGPMVGEKRSSHAITEEYAKADPVYVAKTAALPQTYSHYRPIAGDGNCGWRATGFSYYEYLLRSQSAAYLEEEIARITSLDNLLTTAGGFDRWLIEDMTEETVILLRDLADVVETSPEDAARVLRNRFNDPSASMSIIYHLRLLASSLLGSNPSKYAGFIPDGLGVEGYRKTCLETVNTEIDHLGMALVMDVLLKPIGITVEIVYLDRSEGSEANSHIFQSEDIPPNPGGPMIHLLYRPSHYDILYKEDIPMPVQQQTMDDVSRSSNIQVNRAQSLRQQHHIQNTTTNMADFSQLDLNALLSIPGYSLTPQPSNNGYSSHYEAPIDQTYLRSPMSASISPISRSSSMSTPSSAIMPPSYPTQQTISHSQSISAPNIQVQNHVPQYPGPTTQLPIHTLMPSAPVSHRPSLAPNPPMSSDMPSPVSTTSAFRPSKYEYTAAAEPVVFQTSTFRNSHFNTAHYNNPNFQPEEWTPDSEDQPARKKST